MGGHAHDQAHDRGSRGIVAVLGATGQQGGAVVRALQRRARPVRAVVRDPRGAGAVELGRLGVEVVVADQADPVALDAAFAGVEAVFSVQPSSGQPGSEVTDAEEIALGIGVADAAVRSGVSHVVYSSANAAASGTTGIGHFDSKHRIEEHLRGLGVGWTIVRPAAFMEFLVGSSDLAEGRASFLMRADQPMQFVAVDDIGAVVAAVLTDAPAHRGRTIELAGDTLTGDDAARVLSVAARRPVRYERFGPELLAPGTLLGALAELIDDGPLAGTASLDRLRAEFPFLRDLAMWLAGPGAPVLAEALGSGR